MHNNEVYNLNNGVEKNNQDTTQNQEQHIRDLELDPDRRTNHININAYQYSDQNQQQQQRLPTQNNQNQSNSGLDQVKSMMTGFTPTANNLNNIPDLIKNGNQDWADTWFAIFLQKLIKSKKI